MGQGLTTGGVTIAPDPTMYRILTQAMPQQLLAVDARPVSSTENSRHAAARARLASFRAIRKYGPV